MGGEVVIHGYEEDHLVFHGKGGPLPLTGRDGSRDGG